MVTIVPGDEFKRQAKRLAKKYRSLKKDLSVLQAELKQNPLLGSDLGNGVRKVRLEIASKGKGKSGGARIITYQLIRTEIETRLVLLTIYDKSEISNVRDGYIRSLIRDAISNS